MSVKNRQLNWMGWAALAGYLVILFLMARDYWHAKFPFLFLGIFMLLTLLVVLAFRAFTQLEARSEDKK